MSQPAILPGPEALTPEWLTSALRACGALEGAEVIRFDASSLGEGVGILGQLVRVSLDYDTDVDEAPKSVIAKFPTATPENRAIGHGLGHYAASVTT